MDEERQLLSSLSEQRQQCVAVPGLPNVPLWDIHRSQLSSMKLDAQESSAPLFSEHALAWPVFLSLRPGGGHGVPAVCCPRECFHFPRVRIRLP